MSVPGSSHRAFTNLGVQVSLTIVAVGFAGAALLLLATGTPLTRLSVTATCLAVATLLFSGNSRLACLYGLLLSAPLSLGKNFLVVPHMGGALSYRIDLVDFFVLGLLAFQLQDRFSGQTTTAWRVPRLCWPWIGLMLLGVVFLVMGPFRTLTGMEMVRMIKCLLLFLVLVNELRRVQQFGHAVVA